MGPNQSIEITYRFGTRRPTECDKSYGQREPSLLDFFFSYTAHAALSIFPELARLADSLTRWTTDEFG